MSLKLLDLFCCGGGAGMGYHRAGFTVTGVDIKHQPDYPFDFHQEDVMQWLPTINLTAFDLIHASPPCQKFSRTAMLALAQGKKASDIDLLTPLRPMLQASGVPYVIENVPGAPMLDPIQLCGSSFGLGVQRHRLFESNLLLTPLPCDHASFDVDPVSGKPRPWGVYYSPGDSIPSGGRTARDVAHARELLGIDWLPWSRLKEAIPPAYTEWLGYQIRYLVEHGETSGDLVQDRRLRAKDHQPPTLQQALVTVAAHGDDR